MARSRTPRRSTAAIGISKSNLTSVLWRMRYVDGPHPVIARKGIRSAREPLTATDLGFLADSARSKTAYWAEPRLVPVGWTRIRAVMQRVEGQLFPVDRRFGCGVRLVKPLSARCASRWPDLFVSPASPSSSPQQNVARSRR